MSVSAWVKSSPASTTLPLSGSKMQDQLREVDLPQPPAHEAKRLAAVGGSLRHGRDAPPAASAEGLERHAPARGLRHAPNSPLEQARNGLPTDTGETGTCSRQDATARGQRAEKRQPGGDDASQAADPNRLER